MSNFLFVYFTGEHEMGEQVYFSISKDGKNFKDLNKGQPVLISNINKKGVRDPFILKHPKKNHFYLIATDLKIGSEGDWHTAQNAGSKDIIIWETDDLINWSNPRAVTVGLPEAGNVWAPEAIYDTDKEAFFVFWASKINGKHRIYGSHTVDFINFDSPFLFAEKEYDIIDSTIIHEDGYFYRFTKNEKNKRIILEKAPQLFGNYEEIYSPVLNQLAGVEGPEVYQVEEHLWYLILDRFMEGKGYNLLSTKNLSSGEFTIFPEGSYDFGKNKKRHGGVMAITTEEYQRLQSHYN